MVDDCFDQLRQLRLIDDKDRVTPDGLRCMRDFEPLQRAVRHHYRVEGSDRVKRPVVGQLMGTFVAFDRLGRLLHGGRGRTAPRSAIRREGRGGIAAVKLTALMPCDAGVLDFDGFPGTLRWLRPADKRAVERRRRRTP